MTPSISVCLWLRYVQYMHILYVQVELETKICWRCLNNYTNRLLLHTYLVAQGMACPPLHGSVCVLHCHCHWCELYWWLWSWWSESIVDVRVWKTGVWWTGEDGIGRCGEEGRVRGVWRERCIGQPRAGAHGSS